MELFPFFVCNCSVQFSGLQPNFNTGVVNLNRFRIFPSGPMKWTDKARFSFTTVKKAKKQLDGAKIVDRLKICPISILLQKFTLIKLEDRNKLALNAFFCVRFKGFIDSDVNIGMNGMIHV